MSGLADPPKVSFAPTVTTHGRGSTRSIPVLSSSVTSANPVPRSSPVHHDPLRSVDPMDVSTSSATMAAPAPPARSSPDSDRATGGGAGGGAAAASAAAGSGANGENGSSNNGPNQAIGAAAAAQQPKVVQTAFIHKLYNMLEDPSIQHLISWSNTNDSFVMSPTSEFSKVLAQYFKHTNISSFVRQLNMYGFHKVSDVFHAGTNESPLWEFKHGNGNFKRGDLVGLREIKRRASRHALIHRDSFPGHTKATVASQPGTPAEPVQDATETRLMHLEHSLYDVYGRLNRAEEGNMALNSRCQAMAEGLSRCYHWSYSISRFVQALVPDRESHLYRDAQALTQAVVSMQAELERHLESVRALENPHDPYLSVRQPYYANVSVDPPGPPLSPRQMPPDESRRPSMVDNLRPGIIRPPMPPHLTASPRRYGSVSAAAGSSPNHPNRPQIPSVVTPQQPMPPHPLSSASSPPNPGPVRRHTSADIRQHGWPPPGESPFPSPHHPHHPNHQAAAPPPPAWPPSPHRTPNSSDQQVREVLAQYEMGAPRRPPPEGYRHISPPANEPPSSSMLSAENGLTFGSRYPRQESSLPATRRSSMASNVHSLLNPADTAERSDEDLPDDRKRKRLE